MPEESNVIGVVDLGNGATINVVGVEWDGGLAMTILTADTGATWWAAPTSAAARLAAEEYWKDIASEDPGEFVDHCGADVIVGALIAGTDLEELVRRIVEHPAQEWARDNCERHGTVRVTDEEAWQDEDEDSIRTSPDAAFYLRTRAGEGP